MHTLRQLPAWLALALAGTCAAAGTLTGTVASDGKPLAGAMVTAIDAAKERRDTVYTDAQGRFTLKVDFTGKTAVRARTPYYRDESKELDLAAGDAEHKLAFAMVRHSVAAELSASLGASAQLTKLAFPSQDTRQAFISQCNFCHQVGNELTRPVRDEAAWGATVRRMENYLSVLTTKQARDITHVLAQGFDGKPVAAVQQHPWQPEVARATVKEWVVGDGMTFIHDADVGKDEHLYGVDEGHDLVWQLDRRSGKVAQTKLPDTDLPEGGVFAGVQLPIGVFTGKHGPHSMAQAEDGKFWITNALSSTLMSFDPATQAMKLYDVGRSSLYPHTVRIDAQGIVWFTIVASNQVARFDPKTEQFTIIRLPSNGFWRGVTDYAFPWLLKIAAWFPKQNLHMGASHHKWTNQGREVFNFPYGIDVNPLDGSIWYAKLYAHKIGRIDAKTLAVTEWDTPLRGPRRLRFDVAGNLWIPAFDDSGLMKFDTRTQRFETFKLPLLAHNEYEVPYALAVHPKTQQVWITSNMSDRIFRFDPPTKTFISYAMPTRVTWLRDLVFTQDGGVCSSSSNLPAYGIEGGRASFICLYPDGEQPVPAKLASQ
jgi:virginiamycin B lyase